VLRALCRAPASLRAVRAMRIRWALVYALLVVVVAGTAIAAGSIR
jgi:hypothetical protein